jgi:signal transduction histidine kinase
LIDRYQFLVPDFQSKEPKELALLSIISQSFFQPFSIEDNLLVILTALTSGSGVGFNRAMLFRTSGDKLKGEVWLGPRSAEEAKTIWEVLSTPGIGYVEIIEHNRGLLTRETDSLSQIIKPLVYSLSQENLIIPAMSAARKEMILVRNSRQEPFVDPKFLEIIGVDEFLCVPLFALDEIMGVVILDNAYTRQTIEPKDIKLASLCGLMAGNYMYTTMLHNKMIEMERLAALGEMAIFITHQLRNPLTTIGGFTDQLLNSPNDASKKRRNLEIIRKEIGRLENVLYELVHFLKVEMKKPVPFDLRPEIQAVLQSSDIKIKSEGIEVLVDIEERLPKILGDPTYFGEAIRNLLDNALEATPQGGRVTVQSRWEDQNWVIVRIQDTGKGMPPAVKEKLFSPFFSTKDKGLGLGLLFVKRVMESCGGKIEVDSEAGQGTLFRLYFKSAEEGRSDA